MRIPPRLYIVGENLGLDSVKSIVSKPAAVSYLSLLRRLKKRGYNLQFFLPVGAERCASTFANAGASLARRS